MLSLTFSQDCDLAWRADLSRFKSYPPCLLKVLLSVKISNVLDGAGAGCAGAGAWSWLWWDTYEVYGAGGDTYCVYNKDVEPSTEPVDTKQE